jgi:hypothetical protein
MVFIYTATLSALRPTPNLGNQAPVFKSTSDRVAQLYPQTLGSISVAFYVSQGYRGDILSHLLMGNIYHTHAKRTADKQPTMFRTSLSNLSVVLQR